MWLLSSISCVYEELTSHVCTTSIQKDVQATLFSTGCILYPSSLPLLWTSNSTWKTFTLVLQFLLYIRTFVFFLVLDCSCWGYIPEHIEKWWVLSCQVCISSCWAPLYLDGQIMYSFSFHSLFCSLYATILLMTSLIVFECKVNGFSFFLLFFFKKIHTNAQQCFCKLMN